MTKKHFIELADAVRFASEPFTDSQLETLCRFCASQNPRFNREQWLGYVKGLNGPSGGTMKRERLRRDGRA